MTIAAAVAVVLYPKRSGWSCTSENPFYDLVDMTAPFWIAQRKTYEVSSDWNPRAHHVDGAELLAHLVVCNLPVPSTDNLSSIYIDCYP